MRTKTTFCALLLIWAVQGFFFLGEAHAAREPRKALSTSLSDELRSIPLETNEEFLMRTTSAFCGVIANSEPQSNCRRDVRVDYFTYSQNLPGAVPADAVQER